MFRQGKGVHFCFLFFLLATSVCFFLNLHSCWLKSWFAWWYSFSLDVSACVSFRWTRSSRRRDSSLPSKAMALFSDNFNLFCRASLLMFNSSNFFGGFECPHWAVCLVLQVYFLEFLEEKLWEKRMGLEGGHLFLGSKFRSNLVFCL